MPDDFSAHAAGFGGGADPVLRALREAEGGYRTLREEFDRQRLQLARTREAFAEELTRTREQLSAEAARATEQLAAERREAARQRERAEQLRAALKEIQESLFGGDVQALVLQSCVRLTDASRGLYITTAGGPARVMASLGFEHVRPMRGAPSPFIEALARRVLSLGDTVVRGDQDTRGLPEPTEPSDRFDSFAAVPVSVRGDVHGVIVVADKRGGGAFDEDDVETLLHVGDQASVAVKNAQLHGELERTYLATVGMLADAVEVKDAYTGGHCERVSYLARLTAERLGLDDRTRHVTCLGALLHDVGKIGVSDGILNKPGPLLPEEREVVKAHSRIGHDLLQRLPALRPISQVILHHHESFDGTGYPDGLRGDEIPMASRVVSAVDAYCAMVDRRSYKQPYTDEEARAELNRCSGAQFDPAVVEALIAVLDSAESREVPTGGMPDCGFQPSLVRP
jgi:HD-GYP domain-containing protein (c-di-GMP phosphodiesterase class II)